MLVLHFHLGDLRQLMGTLVSTQQNFAIFGDQHCSMRVLNETEQFLPAALAEAGLELTL